MLQSELRGVPLHPTAQVAELLVVWRGHVVACLCESDHLVVPGVVGGAMCISATAGFFFCNFLCTKLVVLSKGTHKCQEWQWSVIFELLSSDWNEFQRELKNYMNQNNKIALW